MSVMRRPCRAIDCSRGARGTARVAGLTQEFLPGHFEVARRDLLMTLCRLGHRTRSSAHVWTCSAPRDRPPCCNRAPFNAPVAVSVALVPKFGAVAGPHLRVAETVGGHGEFDRNERVVAPAVELRPVGEDVVGHR